MLTAAALASGAALTFGSAGIAHAHGTFTPPPTVPHARGHSQGPFSVLHQGPFSVLHQGGAPGAGKLLPSGN